MQVQQRVLWICLAALLITSPLWFEALTMPGDSVFVWRWTEHQMFVESIISVVLLVAVIGGYFAFRKGAVDWPQWRVLRIGLWIWIALVTLLAAFSVLMYSMGEQRIAAQFETDDFVISAFEVGGTEEESAQFFVVMSCAQTALYKRVIHLDRFVGADSVEFRQRDDDTVSAHYMIDGRELRYEVYDVAELYRQCLSGDSPRPFTP